MRDELCTMHGKLLGKRNTCPGCREDSLNKSKICVNCKIKNCDELKKNNYTYCFSCAQFPCARIKHLDKRYRTKYGMSMIENLEHINKSGIRDFIENERVPMDMS